MGEPDSPVAHPATIFSARATRFIFYGTLAVLLVAVGVLSARAIGEPNRTQAAVNRGIAAEQQRQADEQARQAAEQERQGRALCQSWKQTAESVVPAKSSDLIRSTVRTAADAYRLVHCDRFAGPLGQVDPNAYRPAPTQQDTGSYHPRPSRRTVDRARGGAHPRAARLALPPRPAPAPRPPVPRLRVQPAG